MKTPQKACSVLEIHFIEEQLNAGVCFLHP